MYNAGREEAVFLLSLSICRCLLLLVPVLLWPAALSARVRFPLRYVWLYLVGKLTMQMAAQKDVKNVTVYV